MDDALTPAEDLDTTKPAGPLLPAAAPVAEARALETMPLAAWLAPALALPLVELAIDVRLGARVRVSSPVCAVVRGLMGQRLRDLRCLTGAARCAGCPAASACDYGRVFEGASPHPFWLQGVPATPALDGGARFTARLLLAAPAHDVAPYLDVALRDALRTLDGGAVLSATRVRAGTVDELAPAVASAGPLRLRSETPLVLRGDADRARGLCLRVPWLGLLARAGVRRLDALVRAFAPPPGGRLPRAGLPDVTRAAPIGGGLEPWAGSRFSHRQRQRIPLEGLHGEAVLDGPGVADLTPLVRALTVTGVGKATSLGFGALRMVSGG